VCIDENKDTFNANKCYVMFRYVSLCYVMLCYVMLCYVMLSVISNTVHSNIPRLTTSYSFGSKTVFISFLTIVLTFMKSTHRYSLMVDDATIMVKVTYHIPLVLIRHCISEQT